MELAWSFQDCPIDDQGLDEDSIIIRDARTADKDHWTAAPSRDSGAMWVFQNWHSPKRMLKGRRIHALIDSKFSLPRKMEVKKEK